MFLRDFFFLQIERLLFVLLSTEDSDFDVVGQRRGSLCAIAIRLHLASLHFEGHLVFAISSFLRRGRDRSVVVKHDAVESVVDQILQIGRGLGSNGIHQHARVRIRGLDAG